QPLALPLSYPGSAGVAARHVSAGAAGGVIAEALGASYSDRRCAGGRKRNRTAVRGFAVLCIATLPSGRMRPRYRAGAREGSRQPPSAARVGYVQAEIVLTQARLYKSAHPIPLNPCTSMIDSGAARLTMVESQLRPNKVTDQRVLDAFLAVPRERFVPPALASAAYVDDDLPL